MGHGTDPRFGGFRAVRRPACSMPCLHKCASRCRGAPVNPRQLPASSDRCGAPDSLLLTGPSGHSASRPPVACPPAAGHNAFVRETCPFTRRFPHSVSLRRLCAAQFHTRHTPLALPTVRNPVRLSEPDPPCHRRSHPPVRNDRQPARNGRKWIEYGTLAAGW